MNKLHFIATGDKYNSYRAILNGKDVDSCDINSKDCVTLPMRFYLLINSMNKRLE